MPEAEAEFRIASQQFSMLPTANRFYGPYPKLTSLPSRFSKAGLIRQRTDWNRPNRFSQTSQTPGLLSASTRRSVSCIFGRGNLQEAEQALQSALRVSELHLRSLGTEADRLAWERDTALSYRMLVELYAREPDAARALEVWEWYRASALRGSTPSSFGRDLSANLSAGPSPRLLLRVGHTLPALQTRNGYFLCVPAFRSCCLGIRQSWSELRVDCRLKRGIGRSRQRLRAPVRRSIL